MDNFMYRFYEERYPSAGETVIVKIIRITELGVYVELVEYNNIEGLILVGELSKKKIKCISTTLKSGKHEAATILRVDKEKGYIDISRKSTSTEDAEIAIKRYAQNKQAHSVMIMAAQRLGVPIGDLYEEYFVKSRPHTIYHHFQKITEDDKLFEFVKMKFSAPKFKIRVDIDVSCYKGVDSLIYCLNAAKEDDKNVEITLIKPPVYSISLVDGDKQEGLMKIRRACEKVRERILSVGGRFKICNEPIVYGDKGYDEVDFDRSRTVNIELCDTTNCED